ncbi:hypothetical protein [Amycolatopsis suaedae]|uniref:Uncharacterized protein n=1 Tax=Amycolatopsis suaedae TaxID=2510978 RepID=A0A4Q7JB35_9PSEU|nr:hypothetical protein [Amycolatopsis suaedae]RZQ63703.1 hypothetical protein EWH70_11025 [Amycolatopsis suaedae]
MAKKPPKDLAPHVELYHEPFDDHVADVATTFGSWIEYLTRPDLHDGPRRYTCTKCGYGEEFDRKSQDPNYSLDCECTLGIPPRNLANESFPEIDSSIELRSVFDGIDPARFFHALHALSNVWHNPPGEIGQTFAKLVHPFLLNSAATRKNEGDYPLSPSGSLESVRDALSDVRDGILDERRFEILKYHQRAIEYSIGHENQMLTLAEALGRYRSIHLEALNNVRDLMDKMTERFDQKVHPPEAGGGGEGISFVAAAIAALVGAATTVATGPGGAAAMVGILSALGSIATDAAKGAEKERPIQGESWNELAEDFLRECTRIGNEAYDAVTSLAESITSQLEAIRNRPVWIANDAQNGGNETPRLQPPQVPLL